MCFSWKQKYFLPRSKNLGYCTFGDERVALSKCLQKCIENGNQLTCKKFVRYMKSRFHCKSFRILFLTFTLFLTHLRLLFTSCTP